jgi:hypothetical protein
LSGDGFPEVDAVLQAGLEGMVAKRLGSEYAGVLTSDWLKIKCLRVHDSVEHDITIVESIPMLDEAAIDAVRRWRFSPGRNRDGTPVRVLLEVPLRFTLGAED